ncbi:permease, partial [Mycobacterium sp. ITM-2017-0098]
NIGLTLVIGAPVAVLSWYIGAFLVSQFIGKRIHVDIPTSLFGGINGGRDVGGSVDADKVLDADGMVDADGTAVAGTARTATRTAP